MNMICMCMKNKNASFENREKLLKKEIVLILPNIRSVYNVGSMFRTSDCAAINKIYVTGWTATPEHPKMAKVALGANQSVSWEYCKSDWRLIDKLKKQGYFILSLEYNKDSVDIRSSGKYLKYPLAVIVGNEVTGVSKSLLKRSDLVCHLPMHGIKESLNVASAGAIALYYLRYFI